MLTVVITGCIVVLACWCMLSRVSGQMRREFQIEIDTLSTAVRALVPIRAEQRAAVDTAPPAYIPKIEIVAAKPTEPIVVPDQESTAISAETQVVIKAALSAFLGHEIRIRSMELVETPDVATAWATQGRIAVQTSHNQRTNRG